MARWIVKYCSRTDPKTNGLARHPQHNSIQKIWHDNLNAAYQQCAYQSLVHNDYRFWVEELLVGDEDDCYHTMTRFIDHCGFRYCLKYCLKCGHFLGSKQVEQ